jgi:sialate O-acetylesterase
MKTRFLVFLFIVAVMACTTAAFADVRMPEVFDNNMVLQRDMPVPIWGWAEPGEEVSVMLVTPAFFTRTTPVTADADGKWSAQFPPLPTIAEPATLTIKGKNEIKLENVLVGDVWLCSGQSNMEWTMSWSDKAEYEEVLKTVDNPNIRLFHVRKVFNADPQEKLILDASWKPCSAETIPNFSAVALHFGRKLQAELNVPIGLINSSWGGTRIEPWTPPVGFQSVPALKNIADEIELKNPQSAAYKELLDRTLREQRAWLDEYSKPTGIRVLPPPKFPNQLLPYSNEQQPTTLYNAMIHPMTPFAMKGAIWYQGESNMGEGMLYAEKMKALIQGWRTVFNNPDLGFYYVQLAPFIYGDRPMMLPELWEAQSSVEKVVPKTGQAVINDTVDDLRDIHPVRKKPVGERLALLALNRTYGKSEVVCASPEFASLSSNGTSLAVSFRNAKTLTTRDGKSPGWFEIAGADGVYHKVDARILDVLVGEPAIGLSSPHVPKPLAVRYAWDQSAQSNICNEAGLPLGAFRAGTIPDRALFDELVPDGKTFKLLYRFDPTNPALKDNQRQFVYTTDNSGEITGKVKRVGYFLYLVKEGKTQYVFVTMPPLDADLKKLGVPTQASGARFQKRITDVQVLASNVPGVNVGSYPDCCVEFWGCNYGPQNSANMPGASNDKYDFGDSMAPEHSPGYGSMQIHDIAGKQMFLAFNNFGSGSNCDVGIGNNPDPKGHPDWTFSKSAASYSGGVFLVLVEME